MKLRIFPLDINAMVDRINARQPLAVVTKTHGVWDYIAVTEASPGELRELRGERVVNILKSYRGAGLDPVMQKQLVYPVLNPIRAAGYGDCISFTALPDREQWTPETKFNYWDRVIDTQVGEHIYVPDGLSKLLGQDVLDAMSNTRWYDALVFRKGCVTGDIIPLINVMLNPKQRVVIFAPRFFQHLADEWPNTEFISTEYPEKHIYINNFTQLREDIFQKLKKDTEENRYTIYLFQAGAISQAFIYRLFKNNPKHAYLDIGRVLGLWGAKSTGEPPGGWFFYWRKDIMHNMGQYLRTTMSPSRYNTLATATPSWKRRR